MEEARVLIVSSFLLLREGISALLSNDPRWRVVGHVAQGEGVRRVAMQAQADIIIVDMPRADAALIRDLRKVPGAPAIIALSRDADEHTLLRILRAGVQGCLSEESSSNDLITALAAATQGASFLCPAASRALLQDYRRRLQEQVRSGT